MKKYVKIIISVVVVIMVSAVMLFPFRTVVADGETVSYGPLFPLYNVDVRDPIYDESVPTYVSFELFGKEIFGLEMKNNLSNTKINLGESNDYSLQVAANIITEEIGGWESVKRVYDITYCGDELSADNLDYCKTLGEKNYIQCAVFSSSFLTAKSSESGGFNPNSRYDDWMWYLAKTDDGEWELLTWGY